MSDQFATYLNHLTVDQYLDLLAESGWIAEIPEANRPQLEADVRSIFVDNPLYAWTALTMVEIDSESIYEVGGDEFSYQAHLTTLANRSGNIFRPANIREQVLDDTIQIMFQHNSHSYQYNVRAETDYFDEGIISILNQALEADGISKQFFLLPTIDQILRFVLVTAETFQRVMMLRVIPPPQYFIFRRWHSPAKLDTYLLSYYNQSS